MPYQAHTAARPWIPGSVTPASTQSTVAALTSPPFVPPQIRAGEGNAHYSSSRSIKFIILALHTHSTRNKR